GRAFIIVAGEPWYADSQTHRVPGDGQVGEHADHVVTQPADLAAAAADRVVLNRLAVDPGEVLVDRGVGDRQAEFDRPADRVSDEVRRLHSPELHRFSAQDVRVQAWRRLRQLPG